MAEGLGVEHKTVQSVRTESEATGEIPQLDKTVRADGKERRKPIRTAYVDPEPVNQREQVEQASGCKHPGDPAGRRVPANAVLKDKIAHRLTRPASLPGKTPICARPMVSRSSCPERRQACCRATRR